MLVSGVMNTGVSNFSRKNLGFVARAAVSLQQLLLGGVVIE